MKTAILPIGYNDGIDRRLSDTGFVQIRGTYCRILGRVSMNITVVDVSDLQSVSVGDKVTIYSSNQHDDNSIDNVAITCKTIPYEILVHIFPTTKRIIVK